MSRHLIVAIRATLITLVVTGVLYPLLVTGIAQVLFPSQAKGSLVTDERGQVVGSELLAQAFAQRGYFQPRPSAAGEKGYDGTASGASNFGPTSKKVAERAAAEADRFHRENPSAPGPIPAELVTASGSGLDPHISPDAAFWQIPRVAAARSVAASRVRSLVEEEIEGRGLGIFGEPRVNVLVLNLALDRQFGRPVPGAEARSK